MRTSWSTNDFLHTFCVWILLVNGGAARILRLTLEPSLDIAEVVHRRLQTGSYCVALSTADPTQLQKALDWACGSGSTLGNVDCSALQQGGSCYEPNSVINHASYAFDAYYVKQNGASGSCSFNGLATVTQTNPSNGTCVYPSTSSSSLTPTSGSNTTLSSPTASNSSTFGSPTTSIGTTTSSGIGPSLVSLHWMYTFFCAPAVLMVLSCAL